MGTGPVHCTSISASDCVLIVAGVIALLAVGFLIRVFRRAQHNAFQKDSA